MFFTDRTEERKSYNIYFKNTLNSDNWNKAPEYYVKVVETDRSWDYHLCHVEYPFCQYMGGCGKGYTREQVFKDVEIFINDFGDEFIDLFEKNFLGK